MFDSTWQSHKSTESVSTDTQRHSHCQTKATHGCGRGIGAEVAAGCEQGGRNQLQRLTAGSDKDTVVGAKKEWCEWEGGRGGEGGGQVSGAPDENRLDRLRGRVN